MGTAGTGEAGTGISTSPLKDAYKTDQGKSTITKIDTLDDMINDFDVDEEANYDELDRMEHRMEKMETDMDGMVNRQIAMAN